MRLLSQSVTITINNSSSCLVLLLVVIFFPVQLLSELNISKFSLIEKCGIVEEVEGDPRTASPWNVAIFMRSSKDHLKYINSGVLISPSAVLAIFGGEYGAPIGRNRKYFIPPPENFLIVSGLNSTSLKYVDRFTQFAQVSYILPYSGPHEEQNKNFHFWIYHLTKPLNMNTPYAKTPCLPFFLRGLPSSWKLVHGGFTDQTRMSSSTRSPHSLVKETAVALPDPDCDRLFKRHYGRNLSSEHIWCTRTEPTNEVREKACMLHGSVVVTEVLSRWFLAGVTALIPDKKSGGCSENTLYINARIQSHYEWLFHNIQCGSYQFPCYNSTCIPLSSVCNRVPNCPGEDLTDEDPILCGAQLRCRGEDETSCGMNGKCIGVTQICNGVQDCDDGSDEDPDICNPKIPRHSSLSDDRIILRDPDRRPINSRVTQSPTTATARRGSNIPADFLDVRRYKPSARTYDCLPLPVSEGTIVACHNSWTNETIGCSEATENTVATLTCDKFYSPKYKITKLRMTCASGGYWSPYRRFACEANCGILSADESSSLITHALEANRKNAFPWYAAIFRDNKQGSPTFLCGASLIEKQVVLTAAHCVEDIIKLPYTAAEFKVVLAPISSNFEENVGDPVAQLLNIKLVRAPRSYDFKTLQSDIALVHLHEPVEFSQFVRPVCYSNELSRVNPSVGQMGKVAGFGYDELGDVSYTLKYANVPIVNRLECQRLIKTELPSSSFCAGFTNGTALCYGDSGGGIVFLERIASYDRYYLKGVVVSTEASGTGSKSVCNPDSYSIFTNVDTFRGWILETLEQIES